MNRLRYFIKRVMRMDYRRFFATFQKIRRTTGKHTLPLLLDLLRCGLKYNAGYMDYLIARMDKKTPAQRRTVITRGISNNIVRRMNLKADWHYFDDKATFNRHFEQWVHRPFLRFTADTSFDAFAAFAAPLDSLFAKPLEGSSGVGIQRFDRDAFNDLPALYQALLPRAPLILEQTVRQHPAMSALCPTSVNTLRIATLLGDKQEGIVYAFLRIGNGKVMDNVDCGGMAARIDLNTGTLQTPACDKQGHVYLEHPQTGTPILGFQIPFFEEAKAMCLAAMRVVPTVRFVAWDVAITPDGPQFIEGNSFPSHAVPQFDAHYPDGIGILPEFEKFITL